jgi:hypothetical protein
MAKILREMSMSLDGYVTGPDVTPEVPMGSRRRAAARMDVRGPVGRRVPDLRDRALQQPRVR